MSPDKLPGWLYCLCVLVTACTTMQPVDPTPVPHRTVWGESQVIGSAQTADAPVMAGHPGELMLAWRGEDTADVRHMVQIGDLPPRILALRAFSPLDYHLFPAMPDRYHLLWIDRSDQRDLRQLQSALIGSDAIARIGPVSVSGTRDAVYRYDAVSEPGGGVRLVWSSGLQSEPTLSITRIDNAGRALFAETLLDNGDYPALLLLPDSTLTIFWLRDGGLWQGTIRGNTLSSARFITHSPRLQSGDYLARLTAAMDTSHFYLFWQILRQSNQPEVYWLTLPRDSESQPETTLPQPLQVPGASGGRLPDPGFNAGIVAQPTGTPLPVRWLATIPGEHNTLPVAVTLAPPAADSPPDQPPASRLEMIYLRQGEIVGVQPLTAIPPLLNAPALMTDRARNLYLSWAQPAPGVVSDLLLLTTR